MRPNLSIFAKFNSKMGSFVLFSTKFNSNIYSFFCFATNSIQKLIQFSFFNKIQFKSWFNSLVSNKIQFKNIFKMLKLAVFNSIKYSFNMKTWVSDRATRERRSHHSSPCSHLNGCSPKKDYRSERRLQKLTRCASYYWRSLLESC